LTLQLCCIFLLFRVPVTIAHGFNGGELEETGVKTAHLLTVALVHFTYVTYRILYWKVLRVRPPNPPASPTRQTGGHEPVVQAAVGARENRNVGLEP